MSQFFLVLVIHMYTENRRHRVTLFLPGAIEDNDK